MDYCQSLAESLCYVRLSTGSTHPNLTEKLLTVMLILYN